MNADGVKLLSPAPNPVTGTAEITFEMLTASNANITLHDGLGVKIAELFNGPANAGLNKISYDFSELSNGVYYYTLNAAGITRTQKLIIVK